MLNLNCAICVQLFTASDTVQVTKCGHLFHSGCLAQWLEHSKTCPQCRSDCTVDGDDLRRVYFNTAHMKESCVDVGALTAQLDNVQLQLKQMDYALKQQQQQFEEDILRKDEALRQLNCYADDLEERNRMLSSKVIDLRGLIADYISKNKTIFTSCEERQAVEHNGANGTAAANGSQGAVRKFKSDAAAVNGNSLAEEWPELAGAGASNTVNLTKPPQYYSLSRLQCARDEDAETCESWQHFLQLSGTQSDTTSASTQERR